MIDRINNIQSKISFTSKSKKEKEDNKDTRILPNNAKTRLRQSSQKTTSAFTYYTAKGLTGDINSNFYEFLTLGIIPYLAGSGMFMVMFNCVNKYLMPADKKIASIKGKKLALGVILYGVLKTISKSLVTKPVKMATGVDTEMPYENVVFALPKEADEDTTLETQIQQRKIYDSKEFYRKDLLEKEYPNKEYFNKIAKKLGLGENLNDSVSEVSPIIQNIVATSNTAKSLSSYCWAGLGVGLAAQNSWTNFFDTISNRSKYRTKPNEKLTTNIANWFKNFGRNTVEITKSFFKSLIRSCKTLWTGEAGTTGYMKHAGKAFAIFTIALTSILTANSIIRAKNLAKNNNKKTIDDKKESLVL